MLRLLVPLLVLLACAIPGVSGNQETEDGIITDQVRRRLVSDPDVKGYTVKVETKDGVVTLSGTVETGKAKSKAEKLTKKVRGVKGVVNELRVELPRPRS